MAPAAQFYTSVFKNSRITGIRFSWQIVPSVFCTLSQDPDQEKAGRVMAAMLAMTKFDVASLERAYAGAGA